LAQGFEFLLVCKPQSHQELYEWVAFLERSGAVQTLLRKRWTGTRHEIDTYRYVAAVPLREGDDTLPVNWCELTTTTEDGQVIYRNAFATSDAVDASNVVERVAAGRSRWKIENENNNTLKTKGYHFEHNYGHGQRHLSSLLATLILLAYLLHNLLEWMDDKFCLLRQKLPSRKRLFNDIRALTTYSMLRQLGGSARLHVARLVFFSSPQAQYQLGFRQNENCCYRSFSTNAVIPVVGWVEAIAETHRYPDQATM
jgi:hypothetical protein